MEISKLLYKLLNTTGKDNNRWAYATTKLSENLLQNGMLQSRAKTRQLQIIFQDGNEQKFIY